MKRFASALIALMAAAASVIAADDSKCTPFGDPPAEVNHGLYASFVSSHNPLCYRGKLLGPWNDANGEARYACLYEPPSASKQEPLPLIIFLHGSIATADSIWLTGLTKLIAAADVGGKTPGFIALSPEGRYTTHNYPGFDSSGLGWDNWYRQLNPHGDVTIAGTAYGENQDAAAIDHFVSEYLADGKVDRRRIYVMGWSNGAAMALLYTLNRPWIAAAAVYSAPDPFGAFTDPCPQTPVATTPASIKEVQVFSPHVPVMHVRNGCDIGGICPSGNKLARELHAMGDSVDDVILDPDGNQVTSCDDTCGVDEMANGKLGPLASLRAVAHHLKWPASWNDKMLTFLRQHPLR